MNLWRCSLWVVILVLFGCQHTARSPEPPFNKPSQTAIPLSRAGVPLVQGDGRGVLLDHQYFLISYDPQLRWSSWVLYRVTAEELSQTKARRKDRFIVDPLLLQLGMPGAHPDEYDGRIYDRGHMAPSDDFVFSQDANDKTFVMTNMLPQKRALNRGSWKRLEQHVRGWACTEQELRVVTGPIKEASPIKMTKGLGVPHRFFKVILDETPPRKALGFIYRQEDGKAELENQIKTVSAIEKETGYTFFPDLEVSEREKITKTADLTQWVESNCRGKRQKR